MSRACARNVDITFRCAYAGGTLRPLGRKEANSRVRNNTDRGILQLRLGGGTYGWRFHPAAKTKARPFGDRGRERCG